jgi:4-hydroxybenzoate polyprenyltransferase
MNRSVIGPPIFVDLDGTLTKTDMLYESAIFCIKNHPTRLLLCIFWIFKGVAYLKFKLSEGFTFDATLLPLNKDFYQFLVDEKAKGREIILATASNEAIAVEIVNSYPIFSSSVSSNEALNMKGEEKLKRILEMNSVFAYAGNSADDFKIFPFAAESILVAPTREAKRLKETIHFSAEFNDDPIRTTLWIKQLRMHQWLKNLLIFVPMLVSQSYTLNSIFVTTLAFLAFCFLASSTYIFNDLLDLESDRRHLRKRYRPLAAGNISIQHGIFVSGLLFLMSVIVASFLNKVFLGYLLVYLVSTLAYSLKFKKYIGIDVILLASLYTVRILAGAAVIGVPLSFWLLSFSMFIFFSLALVKRCAELKSLMQAGEKATSGRDYNTADYEVLLGLGTSSSLMSVLMYCFYANNNVLTKQYQEPTILWIAIPALAYWLSRMWIKTHRGEMLDDPIVYSLKDRGSLITIFFIVVVTLLAQIL